jgi:thiol-disulfide isomerase/thioredoxin
VARDTIDGKVYHRCRFNDEFFDWDIWIAAEGDPIIATIAPDLTRQFKETGDSRSDAKIEMRLSFTDWNFAPKFDESTFKFTPPEGAEKLDSFFQPPEPEGPHPLLGKVAPPFTLEDLDGKPVELARHLGKEVVILDFWATWCGPCIAAMPEVKATADKFADGGVALYFVNLQEDAETIRAFLEEQKLDVPVALDIEGGVAAEYGVTGIPQTVIIGKDSKVQVVHVGFSNKLQQQLTAEIEDLLAGKDLAAAELAKHEQQSEDAETPEDQQQ